MTCTNLCIENSRMACWLCEMMLATLNIGERKCVSLMGNPFLENFYFVFFLYYFPRV